MTKRKILLAEDDLDDRLIFAEVFDELAKDDFSFQCVEDGLEAINHLNNTLKDGNLPDLIILDQNMPRLNGKEALSYLKASERFKNIPVIIYSTHNENSFIKDCQALGAASVISKPDSYDGFKQMVHSFFSTIEAHTT